MPRKPKAQQQDAFAEVEEQAVAAAEIPEVDPFAPENAIAQSEEIIITAQTRLVELKRRKPSTDTWFRVHPEITCPVWTFKNDEEVYFVTPNMVPSLDGLARQRQAYFWCGETVTRCGVWMVNTEQDGKLDDWSRSAHKVCKNAMGEWTRFVTTGREYECRVATAGHFPEEAPWPKQVGNIRDMLALAFSDAIIDRPDHPVVKKLHAQN